MAVRGGKVSSTDPVAFSRDAEWEQTLEMKARSPPAAPPEPAAPDARAARARDWRPAAADLLQAGRHVPRRALAAGRAGRGGWSFTRRGAASLTVEALRKRRLPAPRHRACAGATKSSFKRSALGPANLWAQACVSPSLLAISEGPAWGKKPLRGAGGLRLGTVALTRDPWRRFRICLRLVEKRTRRPWRRRSR